MVRSKLKQFSVHTAFGEDLKDFDGDSSVSRCLCSLMYFVFNLFFNEKDKNASFWDRKKKADFIFISFACIFKQRY